MSYKPDESTLVAYLYNELNAEERARVEAYLTAHPEAKKELKEISEMRKLMGKWQDSEVNEPTFVFEDKKVVMLSRDNWMTGLMKSSLGIAASIALIMVFAYFTNLSVVKNDMRIQISFGEKKETNTNATPTLSEENIKSWMAESVADNNAQLVGKINDVEANITNDLGYVLQLKDENKEILFDLMTSTENAQRQYVNEILADYSLYLEEQRQNDLQMIQTSFNSLKDNTEVSQIETNQILASIITTVNNQNN